MCPPNKIVFDVANRMIEAKFDKDKVLAIITEVQKQGYSVFFRKIEQKEYLELETLRKIAKLASRNAKFGSYLGVITFIPSKNCITREDFEKFSRIIIGRGEQYMRQISMEFNDNRCLNACRLNIIDNEKYEDHFYYLCMHMKKGDAE